MPWRRVASRKLGLARSIGLACCLVLSTVSLAAAAGGSSASASPRPRHSITIGNAACGHVAINPYSNLTGGEALTVRIKWEGSPSNSGCTVTSADCPVFFGNCNAGYWVVGLFCSTLAATDLANAQGDCDLNNIVVFSDYNDGPNNPADNHGTSYNQCSTLKALGSIFGGLPGTLYCLPEGGGGSGGDNWTEKWHLGKATGYGYGPVEETGSSTPFSPGTAGVDCPPSAANIAKGAIPGYCAFVVLPIEFQYSCALWVCIPNTGLPNDGATENTNDYLATLLQYANAPSNAHHPAPRFVKP